MCECKCGREGKCITSENVCDSVCVCVCVCVCVLCVCVCVSENVSMYVCVRSEYV